MQQPQEQSLATEIVEKRYLLISLWNDNASEVSYSKGFGGGLMASVLTFYFDDLSSNPADY